MPSTVFGNLVTNITREMLAGVPTDETVAIRCDEHETHSIFTTYAEQPPMTLVALIGSNDQLELAIVDDSATGSCWASAWARSWKSVGNIRC